VTAIIIVGIPKLDTARQFEWQHRRVADRGIEMSVGQARTA
jgi:hypothetical protein